VGDARKDSDLDLPINAGPRTPWSPVDRWSTWKKNWAEEWMSPKKARLIHSSGTAGFM
jgi:hypothetical protein